MTKKELIEWLADYDDDTLIVVQVDALEEMVDIVGLDEEVLTGEDGEDVDGIVLLTQPRE